MEKRGALPESSCVIVLRREDGSGGPLTEILREMAPLETHDLLAEDGAGRTLIIKEGEEPAEIGEYAMALLHTMEAEAGLLLQAGVSDVHHRPEEWPAGYREALTALELGSRFRRKERVLIFGDLVLERMVAEIPQETLKGIRRNMMSGGAVRSITAETRETADAFFGADLNLSVAARQMFVHRNTLTYRLDRIQKETGLDLRKFHDAVIFRFLMLMTENEEETDR